MLLLDVAMLLCCMTCMADMYYRGQLSALWCYGGCHAIAVKLQNQRAAGM